MKTKELYAKLADLGFPLFEAEDFQDVSKTLAEVAMSKDLRLWEGFPVILASSMEKKLFNTDAAKMYLKKQPARPNLMFLVLMSLALYKALGLSFSWADELYRSLPKAKVKEFQVLLEKLKNNKDFKLAGHTMSAQRLKSTFKTYFNQGQSGLGNLVAREDELGLEYSLSQVFSPKQKELFLKKLKGEKLTKTEKEYFSRAVKKKVVALDNPDLHRLCRKLLE